MRSKCNGRLDAAGGCKKSAKDLRNIAELEISEMSLGYIQRYPMLHLLGQDKVSDMIDNLDDGKCVAAVIMLDAWDRQVCSLPPNSLEVTHICMKLPMFGTACSQPT